MPLLQLKNVSKSFKGFRVLHNISFSIKNGEVTCIIGPNGAGKTVLLNVLNGIYPPDSGEIIYDGRLINSYDAHERAKIGILRTFQIPRLFNNMTVIENLLIPALSIRKLSYKQALEESEKILKFIQLYDLRYELAKSLSGGQKRLLEIGRALIASPKLLLLDEPLAGVNPVLAESIIEIIKSLKRSGLSIIMVSHETIFLKKIMPDRVIAMGSGRIIAEGSMYEVLNNRVVIESYMGKAFV